MHLVSSIIFHFLLFSNVWNQSLHRYDIIVDKIDYDLNYPMFTIDFDDPTHLRVTKFNKTVYMLHGNFTMNLPFTDELVVRNFFENALLY